MVHIPTNMVALFDGKVDSCTNIKDVLASRSYIKIDKNDTISGNVTFEVKVQGLNSCMDYEFLYVLVKNAPCDFVRSCNVIHDLAPSHNSCIIRCPCEDNCDIVVVIYSLSTNITGSVYEIMLL